MVFGLSSTLPHSGGHISPLQGRREEGNERRRAAPQDDELSVSRVNMNKDVSVSREVGLGRGRRHATPRHATRRNKVLISFRLEGNSEL